MPASPRSSAAASNRPLIEVFVRDRCHLCDVAVPRVHALAEVHGAEVVERDIETRDEWVRDYGLLIPVVAVDGEQICHYTVDEQALSAALRRAARGHVGLMGRLRRRGR